MYIFKKTCTNLKQRQKFKLQVQDISSSKCDRFTTHSFVLVATVLSPPLFICSLSFSQSLFRSLFRFLFHKIIFPSLSAPYSSFSCSFWQLTCYNFFSLERSQRLALISITLEVVAIIYTFRLRLFGSKKNSWTPVLSSVTLYLTQSCKK